ncbi:LytTR family transcriptional regulator DNA-binding domain-containing protein [Neolewinella sp.]|uniref:LytTR family transcriptional regulator DNA-binding domain-containing protein n=1 Tax=Neolewinella sp. TaxID=2993543 RepID=UPI003B51D057
MLSRNPLLRPFPNRPFGRSVVIGHGRTALFVFMALWIFLFPLPRSLAYGAVVFVVAVAYSFVTDRLGVNRSGPQWTLLRWTIDQAILLLLVSTACFLLYNATVGWTVLNLRVLLYITLPTVVVGLFPIVFSGIALQVRAEQDHQRTASRIQVSSLSQGGGAASAKKAEGGVVSAQRTATSTTTLHLPGHESRTLDQPIEQVARELADRGVVRCHPDYLVDPARIVSATADAQGLRLRLRGSDATVPVSPAYFREL